MTQYIISQLQVNQEPLNGYDQSMFRIISFPKLPEFDKSYDTKLYHSKLFY